MDTRCMEEVAIGRKERDTMAMEAMVGMVPRKVITAIKGGEETVVANLAMMAVLVLVGLLRMLRRWPLKALRFRSSWRSASLQTVVLLMVLRNLRGQLLASKAKLPW